MIKQKFLTFLLALLPFGTSVSFIRYFTGAQSDIRILAILAAGMISGLLLFFFPKAQKKVLETAVKFQPLAAVVFTASFVLSFLPYSMSRIQLVSVCILNMVCLSMAFEKQSLFKNATFSALFYAGALSGVGIAFLGRSGLVYICFVVLSLLCRPKTGERTVREIWLDIAFPLFVLIGSFILFIAANHGGACPSVVSESIVMLMIGGLLTTPSSSLRLTLMTVVLMIFGSYVFSTQNAESVFNRKPPVQIERFL